MSARWFGFSPVVVLVSLAVLLGGGLVVMNASGSSHRTEIAAVCNAARAADEVQKAKKPPLSLPLASMPADTSIFADIAATSQARLSALQPLTFTGGDASNKAKLVAGEQAILSMSQAGQTRFVAGGGFANPAGLHGLVDEVRPIFAKQKEQRQLYKSAFDVDCFI